MPSQLPLPLSGTALRDEALDRLEQARRTWLADAAIVVGRQLEKFGEVCADDIHELFPVPEGIDPRVMGAVFRGRRFRVLRYQPSRRAINHARLIPVWGAK